MSEPGAAQVFETWAVSKSRLKIEYSPQTLDEIRAYTMEGRRQLSRGGVEVGGILYGTRGDNLVRILSWRPMQCEHFKGPSFVLSQDDRIALKQALDPARPETALRGLQPVGWFVSHTRAGVQLSESDLKLYNQYFPWTWQIALVLQPQKDGTASAGFFFRDAEGEVKTDGSYRPFTLTPLPPPVKASVSRLYSRNSEADTPAAKTRFARARLWIWAVPLVLAAIVAVMIIRPGSRPATHPANPAIGFHIVDMGRNLRLEWDPNAEPVRDAARAMLDVKDGEVNRNVPITGEQLREGSLLYIRRSGDVDVRMTTFPSKGSPVQESARFVGPAVTKAKTEDSGRVRQERDELVREVGRLQQQLARETKRNHELEEAIRILKNRVAAVEGARSR